MAGMAEQMTASLAAKMTKQVGGKGRYYVENAGQRIGPYRKQANARNRLEYETTVASESGNKGKQPELTYAPKGLKADPAFYKLKRISPAAPSGNGSTSRGYDYRTNQAVRRDTPAQRKTKPRGAQ